MRFAAMLFLSACVTSAAPGSTDDIPGIFEFEVDDGRGITGYGGGTIFVEPYVAWESSCDPSWVLDLYSQGNGAPGILLASESEIAEGASYEVEGSAGFSVGSDEWYWLEVPEDCSAPEHGCRPLPARATLHVDELPADGLHAAFRITGRWCLGDSAWRDGVCADDVTVSVTATGKLVGETQLEAVELDPDGEPTPGEGDAGSLCRPLWLR